jgi:ketosteroid isomerase-like protein
VISVIDRGRAAMVSAWLGPYRGGSQSKGAALASPAEIVEQYFNAWTSKDFATARGLLHDDLSFTGPFDSFTDADSLLASIKGLSQIVEGAERRRLIADGDQVSVVYDLHTGPVGTAPVAEWYTVRDGRIASIEAFFDARPFAPMFER